MEDKEYQTVNTEKEKNDFSDFIDTAFETTQKEKEVRETKEAELKRKIESEKKKREQIKQNRNAVIETIALLVTTLAMTIGLFFLAPKYGVISLGFSILIMMFFLKLVRKNNRAFEMIYEKGSMIMFFVGLGLTIFGFIMVLS